MNVTEKSRHDFLADSLYPSLYLSSVPAFLRSARLCKQTGVQKVNNINTMLEIMRQFTFNRTQLLLGPEGPPVTPSPYYWVCDGGS